MQFKRENEGASKLERTFYWLVLAAGIWALIDGCQDLHAQELPTRPKAIDIDTDAQTMTFDHEGIRRVDWCFLALEILEQDFKNCEANYNVASDAFVACRDLRAVQEQQRELDQAELVQVRFALEAETAARERAQKRLKRLRWVYGAAALAGAALGGIGIVTLVGGS